MELERRTYGPDSSLEEIELLRSRVSLLPNGVIQFKEAPVMSEFQCEVMWSKVEEMIDTNKENYLLVDLTGIEPPNARIRAKIKECVNRFGEHVNHAALVTGRNKIVNLVAKFVVGGLGFQSISFHGTREQALKAIEDAAN